MANRTVTTLTAVLQMNNTKFKKGLSGSQKAMKGFSNQIQKIGGMIAGAFAVRSIIRFGKEAFKLLDVQAKAERSLLVSLNGRIAAQQTLITQAKKLQETTLYGDEETIRAAALIGTMVKEEETIKRLIPLVQDFATAKNMQLSAAADLVAKSIGSSTNALSRYGITITGSVGSAERLNTTVDALTKAFGGQAEAAAEADKNLTQVKNAWGDLQEQFASWLSEGEGGFISRGLMGGIKDLTRLFEESQNPEALKAFKDFNKTLSDKTPAEQVEAMRGRIDELRTSLAGLAKDRRVQQDLIDNGSRVAGRFAKTEIEKIDEIQTLQIATLRIFEDQVKAIGSINEEIDEGVETQEKIFEKWAKINDAVRERIKLQEKLNDALAESIEGILEKKPQGRAPNWYFPDDEEVSEEQDFAESPAAKAIVAAENKFMEMKKRMEALREEMNTALEGFVEEGLANIFAGLGESLVTKDFENFFASILRMFGSFMVKMGSMIIAYGIAMEAFKKAFTNPFAAIAAGVALAAIGGAIIGYSNKLSSAGNSISASRNSSPYSGGVTFRISGNSLVGAQDNEMTRRNIVT